MSGFEPKQSLDKRLGGIHVVEHATVYSAYMRRTTMPVQKMSAEQILGRKPLVLSAQPFHKGLKKVSGSGASRAAKKPARGEATKKSPTAIDEGENVEGAS